MQTTQLCKELLNERCQGYRAEAIANADAELNNVGLPTYAELSGQVEMLKSALRAAYIAMGVPADQA